MKEYKYENPAITTLEAKLANLAFNVSQLESGSFVSNPSFTPTKSVRRKPLYSHNDSITKPNDFSSSLFDDYEEVYEEVDSMGEDQFFHPLEQSTRKYLFEHKISPKPKQETSPSPMNDSFENFTSED